MPHFKRTLVFEDGVNRRDRQRQVETYLQRFRVLLVFPDSTRDRETGFTVYFEDAAGMAAFDAAHPH